MARHDDRTYLRHMLDHARTAVQLSEGKGRADLETQPMLRYALLHLVCILGEAANRISSVGRSKYSHIAWRDLVAMRNMLIHGYDTVDLDILWKTVVEDLPAMVRNLQEVLGECE